MTFPALPALALLILFGLSFLVWLWVSATLLLWGARLAGIERRSFGRAIGTILLGGGASLVLKLVLGTTAPVLGTGLGLLLGLCVSSVVMMGLFDTTFGKALAANILAWVLSLLVIGLLALLFAVLAGVLFAAS